MPNILSPTKDQIILGENSKYTQEQNIALSKQPNTKTPEQLVEENISFVHHLIEKEFARYYRYVGIPRDNLVSAGMMGLVVAANKSKYGTFIRYASFWIRYYIYNEIRSHFFIKRQSSYCLKLNKIRKFQAKYVNKFGKEPSYEWLAENTGFDVGVVIDVLKFDEENSTSTVSYEELQEDPESKNKLDAVIESECDEIDFSRMEYKNLGRFICKILDGDQRDAVIMRYFGHLNNTQISKKLEKKRSPSSVGSLIEKGVQKMKKIADIRKEFQEEYGVSPVFSLPNELKTEEADSILLGVLRKSEVDEAVIESYGLV